MSTIVVKAGSAPSTPGTGYSAVYPKSADKRWYFMDDAGVERGPILSSVLGSPFTATSGTSHDWTGIPTGCNEIILGFTGLSLNGTADFLVQLGSSGGIENTGYLGAASYNGPAEQGANYTTGFGILVGSAASVIHGSMRLTLIDSATFTWAASGTAGSSDVNYTRIFGGSKSLAAELDRIRLTTTNGTDTFDAGKANIIYRF